MRLLSALNEGDRVRVDGCGDGTVEEKTVDATGRTPVTGALVHFDEGGKHRFVDNDGYDVWRRGMFCSRRRS